MAIVKSRRAAAVHQGRDYAGRTRPQRLVEPLLDRLAPPAKRDFAVRLWDGSTLPPPERPATWTLVLNSPSALRTALFHPGELALSEAFLRGEWDVEGDFSHVFALEEALGGYHVTPRDLLRALPLLLKRGHAGDHREEAHRAALTGEQHAPSRDQAAIRFHYDVGNDFYALWLDRQMVYSCAYFAPGVETLEAAQEAKLDLVCRKLRLRPGERFLDVGCGWGALIMHAARHYGVEATGITLSAAQATLAHERIAAAGLADHCQVELRDYRDLPDNWFDKAASIGMAEHVGQSRIRHYFATLHRALKPGGLLLNHAIAAPSARQHPDTRRDAGAFIRQYVFPDGELLSLSTTLAAAEEEGFETCDVESLRRHYITTLGHWLRRLEARQREALALVDQVTYRTWRLYLAGAAHSFAVGQNTIYQSLLSRPASPGSCALPLTRDDLYATDSAGRLGG